MATSDVTSCPHVHEFEWPSPALVQCPFPFYKALRDEAPVYEYKGQYLLSRWEDIVYVSEHPDIFIQNYSQDGLPNPDDEPLTPVSMAGTNAPEHKLKRSLGLKFVAPERLRGYEPMIRAISDELIDQYIATGEMEFHKQFGGKLPVLLVADVLGLPREHIDMYVKWYESSSPAAAALLPEAERLAQERLAEEAYAYMRDAVEQRVKHPRDDYLTEMIQMQVARDGRPAIGYLAAEADLLLFAGNITTTHMLASMMMLLLRHPAQHEKVLADHSLLPGLVEEALRLESPVQYLFRYVTQDVEIGGVAIPKDSIVVIMYASGNRDETRWGDDPDTFDVQRRHVAKHHLAFGRGSHRCLGAPLAKLEGRVAFEQVLTRLKHLRLAERNDFAAMDNILFRAPERVYVEFDPV